MRGRLVLNGTTEIRGSFGESSATQVSLATALWLQTMVPLEQGDTVELQGCFRAADGSFAAGHTSFWGAKVGDPPRIRLSGQPTQVSDGNRDGGYSQCDADQELAKGHQPPKAGCERNPTATAKN